MRYFGGAITAKDVHLLSGTASNPVARIQAVLIFLAWLFMNDPGSISVWIEQLKDGDADAAQPLWERYYHRLVGLARKKLGDLPRRATDEEDVVQSAFRSFFQRAGEGHFP